MCALKIDLAVHLQLEFVFFYTSMTLTIKTSHSMKFRVVVLEITSVITRCTLSI